MPPVAGTSRLVATYLGPDGAQAANVLHFVSIGGDFDQAAGDGIADEWGEFFEVYAQQNWSIDETLEWSDLSEDPPDVLTVSSGGNSGDATQASLPANVAACLSTAAGGGGRSGRGRIYLPGISEEYVIGSAFSQSFIDAVLGAYLTFATNVATTHGWVPAVYSRTDGLSRAVLSVGMSPIVDTQRRRTNRLEN